MANIKSPRGVEVSGPGFRKEVYTYNFSSLEKKGTGEGGNATLLEVLGHVLHPPFLVLSLLLLFFAPSTILGEEVTSPESLTTKEAVHPPAKSEGFFASFAELIKRRAAWGVIDELHYIKEETKEIHADKAGNRLILRTPFGGFLWGYEKAWGEASIFPRRINVFSGRLRKQPFESGSQDARDYGYFIDTKRFKRWLKDGTNLPFDLPADVEGHLIFTDTDGKVGNKSRVNFASERFESIDAALSARINRGRWYGLGFDFLFIPYDAVSFARFGDGPLRFDQKEIVDRDIWRGRITFPVQENFHISGLYEENHDVHHFINTNVTAIFGLPLVLIPDRSIYSTQRKYGPEGKYFFGEDLRKAVSFGFYLYTGESAGRLAEFGLKRAFRLRSAGNFSPLELHNSFGLSIGYDEYEARYRKDEDRKSWGAHFEAGYLDSDSVSRPFSGRVFPPGQTAVRQFDEDLTQMFFKGSFNKHVIPEGDINHPLAGEFNADVSLWDIERKGKQTQVFLPLGRQTLIPNFHDDRRILQMGVNYELDRPKHHFGGAYSISMDFNWDMRTSDKVGSISVGFFY